LQGAVWAALLFNDLCESSKSRVGAQGVCLLKSGVGC
jgi:hypothetical protein